jgi:hypothetical protein
VTTRKRPAADVDRLVEAVAGLVEAMAYAAEVRVCEEGSLWRGWGPQPDRKAAGELRVAAMRAEVAAEIALTDVVGATDHAAGLELARQLVAVPRAAGERARAAYQALPAAQPGPGGGAR